VYPVLKALEDAGRIRRGYFVAGLGGSQFALPGAVDRLRGVRDASEGDTPAAAVLAATDPANPYGAALPWPEDAGRAQRAAGAYVVIVDGALAALVSRDAKDVHALLPAEEPARTRVAGAAAGALAEWFGRTGRSMLGWGSQDDPLNQGALAPFLRAAGFAAIGPGFRLMTAPSIPGEEPAPDPSDQGGDGFHPEGAGDEAALEAGDEPLAVFDGDDEPDL